MRDVSAWARLLVGYCWMFEKARDWWFSLAPIKWDAWKIRRVLWKQITFSTSTLCKQSSPYCMSWLKYIKLLIGLSQKFHLVMQERCDGWEFWETLDSSPSSSIYKLKPKTFWNFLNCLNKTRKKEGNVNSFSSSPMPFSYSFTYHWTS